jgi:hypothetical protein
MKSQIHNRELSIQVIRISLQNLKEDLAIEQRNNTIQFKQEYQI